MFLFRPSNNNQRYAFVPLLDQSDDECDDDREQGRKLENAFIFIRIRRKLHYHFLSRNTCI